MKSTRTWAALFGRSDSSTTRAGAFTNPSGSRGGGGSGAGFWGVRASSLKLAVLTVVAAAALLVLNVGPASALTQRPFEKQIAGFTEPTGLSVDPADDLWVTDPGNAGLITELSPFPADAKIGEQDGEGHFTFEGHYILSAAFSAANEHLYVGDSGEEVVHVFKPSGEFEETWHGFSGFVHVAVDNSGTASDGRVYVSESSGTVKAFKPNGEAEPFSAADPSRPYIEQNKLIGTPTGPGEAVEPFGNAWGITVGTDGNIYVIEQTGRKIDEFEPSGQFVRQFSGAGSNLLAVAVDPTSGNVLAATEASVVNGISAAILEFSPTGALEATITTAGGASFTNIEGLAVDSAGNLYAADRGAGHLDVFGPAEPLPVETDGGSVTAVTDTTALLQGQVTPNGHNTSYAFLLGTADCLTEPSACSEVPFPPAALGNGEAALHVTRALTGLAPGTTYHYRLLVEDTDRHELLPTPDRTFTTQGVLASILLPDSRAWELVSPPDKHGSPLEGLSLGGADIQAAADGSGLAYIAKGPLGPGAEGSRSSANAQLLAHRTQSGGWSTQEITTPHQAPAGLGAVDHSEYRLFSSDLSRAAVEPEGATPLSPAASEKTPYLRLASGEYLPLATGCPEAPAPCSPAVSAAANVPLGTEFGGEEIRPEGFGHSPNFLTGTPDLAHLLLVSPKALTADFGPTYDPPYTAPLNLFEWSEGALSLVSLIPPGEEPACGGPGPACRPAGEAGESSNPGGTERNYRHAISADGSRVAFTTNEESRAALYLRDLRRGQTLRLDLPAPGAEGGQSHPGYQDMSAGGSRVFFTDDARLTVGSTAVQHKPDLYVCEVVEEPNGQLGCDLRDLTVDHNPGEAADILDLTLGASENGSAIYLVANGVLAPGAVSGDCAEIGGSSASRSCNLYRVDVATGQAHLVAVLSGADSPDWNGPGSHELLELTSRISPNGRWLAFMSQRPLTGYDNRDAVSGARDQEVYLYDATANGGEGRLLCASCNPTSARPRGIFDAGGSPGPLVDRPSIWAGQTLAASIPGWNKVNLFHALYQSRYLSNQGRLFFNAADPLVPQDANGTFDVYQYEPPPGAAEPPPADSCTTSSSTYSPASGGCVSLISSGTSPEESAFLDASESGNDVFFLTASRLTGRDVDGALDIYDARVGGGEAEPVKPVECSGDACQQPAVPPSDATPGSLTFSGAGNVVECPKGKGKKNGKCVKKKQQKKAKKHKKKHHQKSGSKKSGAKKKKGKGGK